MEIHSLELIGYDPETKTFPSTVYSNMSPTPLPYRWEVGDDSVTISVSYEPLDATFKGAFSEDGERFDGGWRPNPAADEKVNVPTTSVGIAWSDKRRGHCVSGTTHRVDSQLLAIRRDRSTKPRAPHTPTVATTR